MEHSGDDTAIVEALHGYGFTLADSARFNYPVPGTPIPVEFDLSATDPKHLMGEMVRQAYAEGYERGRGSFKSDVQKLLGIRT